MTHPGSPGEPGFPGMPLTGEAAGSSPAPAYPAAGQGQAGSKDEFARFYREHLPRLAAYLIYQGAPAHLAADLAQDAMATAWRRWAEITEPRAYVYKVAGRVSRPIQGDDGERAGLCFAKWTWTLGSVDRPALCGGFVVAERRTVGLS